jgi:hypothetical protein
MSTETDIASSNSLASLAERAAYAGLQSEQFGALKEDVHIAGYALGRGLCRWRRSPTPCTVRRCR